jgi:hypothetical protein
MSKYWNIQETQKVFEFQKNYFIGVIYML